MCSDFTFYNHDVISWKSPAIASQVNVDHRSAIQLRRYCIANLRFAMPLSTSVIIIEMCYVDSFNLRYAGIPARRFLTILENLCRDFLVVLELSPKDYPFSDYF